MKILISGESSIHLKNYCSAIKPYGYEIILVTETPLEVEAGKSYITSFRSFNPVKGIFSLFKLRKIIANERPSLVHVHEINRLAFFVALCAMTLNIPLISTAWGSDVLLLPQRSFFYRFGIKIVLKYSRFVTADALIMIEAMKKLVASESKYVHLQYGIEPVILSHVKQNLIYSNRLLLPLYNIDLIIRDFAEFVKNNKDWSLIVGATGSETEHLQSLAVSLAVADKIDFTGWLNKEDNHANYARSKIYISVPSSDGTSVSLLEAMSADCIPVVSDLPVSKEWITDGVNGIIKKEGINPFEETLLIDEKRCFEINRKKIEATALRLETTKIFVKLYEQAIRF